MHFKCTVDRLAARRKWLIVLHFSVRYSPGKTKTVVQGQLWSPVCHCSITKLTWSWSNVKLWVYWTYYLVGSLFSLLFVTVPMNPFYFFSSCQIFPEVPADTKPYWSEFVIGFRFMTDRELKRFPDHRFGQAFTTMKCECSSYLKWLEKRFVLIQLFTDTLNICSFKR